MAVDRYSTPDGKLTLLVDRQSEDVAIGFDGFTWHTHADIIAECRGERDEEAALRHYLADIFEDRLPIVVLKKDSAIADVWVSDSPDDLASTKYLESGESLELRRWSGA